MNDVNFPFYCVSISRNIEQESIFANQELVIQNAGKEKRLSELIVDKEKAEERDAIG